MTGTASESAAPGTSLRPLRIEGGFGGAARAALGAWWREIFILTALNLLWTIAFFSVIALPPATAAMFYVARQILSGEYLIDWRTFWLPFRRYAVASWRWGLAVALIGGVAGANLWLYQDAPGTVWNMLRWSWATILVVWAALNLIFWPLWYAQEGSHQTLRTTWRNGTAFLSANPLPALLLTILVGLLGTVSFLTGVILGLLFMVWSALLATAVVAAYLPRVEE